jgi:hypothetical protein
MTCPRMNWLADVEATAARLGAIFRGETSAPPTPVPTYAQQAREDRAAAIGEQRRDAWQDADPFGKEADRAAAKSAHRGSGA